MSYLQQLNNLSSKYNTSNPGFGIQVKSQTLDPKSNKWVIELNDGRKMFHDDPEFKKLLDTGLVHMDSSDKTTWVQNNPNSELRRYKEIESANTFQDWLKSRDKFGQNYSLDPKNAPEDYKKDYDNYIQNKYVEDFFIRNPKQDNEDRGAYLDRITKDLDPSIVDRIYQNMPANQKETYWNQGERGFATLTELPVINKLEDYISNNAEYMSKYEKDKYLKQLEENPNLTRVGSALETLSPIMIAPKAVQSIYRPKYGFNDALSGTQNNEGIVEDVLTDPLNLVGVGLFKNLGRFGKATEMLQDLGKYATENTFLKNTYKYNPYAFKPIEGNFYRQIDEATYLDDLKYGKIRGKQDIIASTEGKISLQKSFGDDAYYNKNSLYYKDNSNLPYLYEANLPEERFIPKLNGRTRNLTVDNTSVRVSKSPINIDEVTTYKKDWLSGYKPIERTHVSDTSKLMNKVDNNPVSSKNTFLPSLNNKKDDPMLNVFNHALSALDNTMVSLIPGQNKKAHDALKSGNEWSKNWYTHPETQRRLDVIQDSESFNDQNNLYFMRQAIEDGGYNSYFQSMGSKIRRFLSSNAPLHQNNIGISYRGLREPIDRNVPMINRTQNFVNKYQPPVDIKATAIHEGNHGVYQTTAKYTDTNKSKMDELLDIFDPSQVEKYKLKNKDQLEYIDYLTEPMETYARIQQIRAENKLNPGDIVSNDDAVQMYFKGLNNKSNVEDSFYKLISPFKLSESMNKLPAVGIGIGTVYGASQITDNKQDGGFTGKSKYWNDYLYSDKYRERLKRECPECSDEEINLEWQRRKGNYKNTVINDFRKTKFGNQNGNTYGTYYSKNRDYRNVPIEYLEEAMYYDQAAPKRALSGKINIYRDDDGNVIDHEIGHSILEGSKRIYTNTIAELSNRLRGANPVGVGNYENYVKQYTNDPDIIKGYTDSKSDNYIPAEVSTVFPNINHGIKGFPGSRRPVGFSYLSDPSEVLTRLNTVRKEFQKRGIANPTDEFTKEHWDKFIEEDEKNPLHEDVQDFMNELKGKTPEEVRDNAIWMLNNIADNNATKKGQYYAQKGGSTPSLKEELDKLSKRYSKFHTQ